MNLFNPKGCPYKRAVMIYLVLFSLTPDENIIKDNLFRGLCMTLFQPCLCHRGQPMQLALLAQEGFLH